jgi:hypothetical protein
MSSCSGLVPLRDLFQVRIRSRWILSPDGA